MATDNPYFKQVNSMFKEDFATIESGVVGTIVFLDVMDGVNDSQAQLQLKPKQARKLAKALKKAARRAES